MIFTSMTEDELQMHIVHWLDASLPMGSVVHHSPNEGKQARCLQGGLKSWAWRLAGLIWKSLCLTGWNDLSRQRPDNDRTEAPIRRQLVS
jgi:hypothetical protein